MDPLIYLLLLLIVLSGFFSSAEIALFSLSQAKVRALAEKKVKNGAVLAALKDRPQKLLITILIGNNLVNIGSASLATVVATKEFGSAGVGIATGVMTALILFFGEIVPKTFAQRNAESYSLKLAPVMRILMWTLYPIVWLMNVSTIVVQRVFRIEEGGLAVSEEDVKAMVVMGHEEGTVEQDEREMIEKVFQLNDITAENVMTPEEYVVSFDADTTIRETLHVIQETGYSRFPVFAGTSDVEGILYIKDVFSYLAKHHALDGDGIDASNVIDDTKVSAVMKPAMFVPETTQADELMKEFQKKRKHIAIVVDEHGSAQGLVTLEDLLEEIVGEIIDESDYDEKMLKRVDENTIEIDPRVSIGKVNAVFDSDVKGPRHKTIGWLVLKNFGKIPVKGDDVTINDFKFIVDEADDRRIKRLVMIRTAKAKLK
jgi:CBS domain containing-hemolysin-like protein